MYTHPRVSEYLKTRHQDFKIISERQETFPMKTLLRSSVVALLVFAGYAAFSSDTHLAVGTVGRPPQAPCLPPALSHSSFCVK